MEAWKMIGGERAEHEEDLMSDPRAWGLTESRIFITVLTEEPASQHKLLRSAMLLRWREFWRMHLIRHTVRCWRGDMVLPSNRAMLEERKRRSYTSHADIRCLSFQIFGKRIHYDGSGQIFLKYYGFYMIWFSRSCAGVLHIVSMFYHGVGLEDHCYTECNQSGDYF